MGEEGDEEDFGGGVEDFGIIFLFWGVFVYECLELIGAGLPCMLEGGFISFFSSSRSCETINGPPT